MINILLMVLCVEAIVFYMFYAAPLQRIRSSIINWTPFLRIGGDHLFECKICLSFWVGVVLSILYIYNININIIVYSLVFARLSNFVHLIFSLINDIQMDIRINRGRRINK